MHRRLAMQRKLNHTYRALGLVLSLATVALIAAVPLPGATDAAFAHGAAVVPAATSVAAPTVAPSARTGAAKASSRHRRAQAREAMALPFFSFAQGLRRGNRS